MRECSSAVNSGAGFAEQAQHLVVMHHDAGVAQDREAGVLDRLNLLVG